MAHKVNRQISIRWKLNPDSFGVINSKVISDFTRKFGSTQVAVNAILVKDDMMKMLMPFVIGVSPSDPSWNKRIADYWHSLSVDIPSGGKDLEIGFSFDLDDKLRQDNIKDIKSKNKGITTSEDLARVVLANVDEEEMYKYGTPLVIEDYLLWIYSFKYHDVANTPEELEKSTSIRFYIHDEKIVKAKQAALVDIALEAQGILINTLAKDNATTRIYDILSVLEPSGISSFDTMTPKDRQIKIFELVSLKPKEFIEIANDANLEIRSLIEKLLNARILRKLPNTDIIVDVEDPSIQIGATTADAISWFSITTNDPKIGEYKTRLKANNK